MNLAAHDRALKKFRYGEALDSALAGGRTEVVAAVIGELVHRGGLRTALAGRDASALLPVLAFVARHIAEPRHAQQMCGVLDRVLDIYGGSVGASPEVDAKLRQMKERLVVELRLQEELCKLHGLAAPLLAAGAAAVAR